MVHIRLPLIVAVVVSPFVAHQSAAGPLTAAEVTKIINQVSVIDPRSGHRPAEVRDVIKDDLGLQTGLKSRSELLFQDNTLTRIGAETFFSFRTGTRDLTLEKGSMLLQVPKGLGGAQIHTAAVTAAITGTTIMMEYVPKQYIKVLVLEGSLRLSRNGVFGDSLVLRPGKMVVMRPDAKKIPDPVDVDLQHIVQTSSLVNFPGAEPLPSMLLIQAAIEEQAKRLAKNNLAPTNLVMGHGTNVIVATADQLAKVLSPGGTLSTALNAPIAGVKSGTLSLPLVGSVVSGPTTTTVAATTAVNNVLSSTTGSVGLVANNLSGAASTVPSVPVSTTTVDNLLASATGTVSSVANNLSAAAAIVTSIPVSATAVDSLLSSTSGTVGAVSTSLSGAASAVTSIPVSSSSQLISLLANAVPSASGSVTIAAPAAPASTSVPAVSTAPATPTSNPAVSSVSTAITGTTGSASNSVSPAGSTSPTASSSTAPVLSSPTTTSVSSPVLTTVASAPTTLATVTVATQSSTTSSGSLSLGH